MPDPAERPNTHGDVDVTAILVNYNTCHLLPEAIGALRRAGAGLRLKIVVVDNASRDGSAAWLREAQRNGDPDLVLIENNANLGFGRANNQAMVAVEGGHVLLVNTDAFVAPDTLEKTLAYMKEHPRCGVLGVRLVGRDGQLQPSARYFPTPWNLFLQRTGLAPFFPAARLIDDLSWPHDAVRQCDWVPGCYYLVRREVIDQVGLFDPRYFLYYEEVDHCLATKRAGWEVTFFPHTSVIHLGGESAKSDGKVTPSGRQIEALQLESELLYFRKNHGFTALLANIALTIAGDALKAGKRLLQRHRPLALGACWDRTRLTCSLLFHTRWGTRPTR